MKYRWMTNPLLADGGVSTSSEIGIDADQLAELRRRGAV